MLWVGGHILLVGTDELGLTFLYDAVKYVEEAAKEATGALGSVVGWLVNTLASALLGLVVGAVVVIVMSLTLHRRKAQPADTASEAKA
jgi:predicted DNA repair protein MutK